MLIIDSRMGHSPGHTRSDRVDEFLAGLRRLGVPAKASRLKFGDVSFAGKGPSGDVRVGIELKTVGGLLADMTSGRFVGHQVGGMQQTYQYRYLVIEGAMRGSLRDGMLEVPRGNGHWWSPSPLMYVDFLKWLQDITLLGGFHRERTWDKADTISTVAAIYGFFQKDWRAHKALKQFNEAQDTGVVFMSEPSLARRWAKELDGVGWEKSADIERVFKTGEAIALASVKQLMQVPGVGEKIARRAFRDIRGMK